MVFPSFKTWGSALRLSVIPYLGMMAFPLLFWLYLMLGISIFITNHFQPDLLFFFCIAIALTTLFIGLLLYLAIKIVWRFMLRLLWSNPPQWLLPTQGLSKNLHKFAIIITATLSLSILYFLVVYSRASVEISVIRAASSETYARALGAEVRRIVADSQFSVSFIMRFYWLWLISSAYLLHWFPVRKYHKE